MNLLTIESRLYDRLSLTGTSDAVIIARLRGHLNLAHRDVMRKKQMKRYRRAVLPFTSVANSPYVALPWAATKVYNIQDRANQRNLDEKTTDEILAMDPGLTRNSSFPDVFAIFNFASAVARQPSAAAELFFKSTAAGDGATKTAFLEGITTGGYPRSVSVAMNGVTAVSFGALITDWIEVQKFYINLTAGGVTTAAGNVMLLEGSGIGTELARIPIGRAYPRYTTVQLYPFPTAANSYYASVDVHIEDMATAGDEPLIPEDFHDILIEQALMYEYELRENAVQYAAARARRKEIWTALCMYASRQVTQDDSRPMRWSQLGPYFPAGS